VSAQVAAVAASAVAISIVAHWAPTLGTRAEPRPATSAAIA